MNIFARFSKALGALGGGGIAQLVNLGAAALHHPLSNGWQIGVSIAGSVIATALAPPNSLSTSTSTPSDAQTVPQQSQTAGIAGKEKSP